MRLSLRRWRLLWLLCFAFQAYGEDYGFSILRAHLQPAGDEYVLDADIDYRFNPPAIDALENGVPLTLAINLSIRRQREFWLDDIIVNEQRHILVRYHPLAKSFQIVDQKTDAIQNFASLSALLDALGRIRNWRITPENRLDTTETYHARLSVDLDIESLPLPLRVVAYLSPDWYLQSPIFEWHFEP